MSPGDISGAEVVTHSLWTLLKGLRIKEFLQPILLSSAGGSIVKQVSEEFTRRWAMKLSIHRVTQLSPLLPAEGLTMLLDGCIEFRDLTSEAAV